MTDSRLARAQAGDTDAFEESIGPYRRKRYLHWYRILGSYQDTLRAWRP
jgi:DNA-directed RNA polymerase specialized sigma24 family protein